MIKKKYEEYKEKFDLPSFDSLDHDFEVSSMDTEDFILREIRRKITEKADFFSKVLDGVLQPESIISNMQECHIFSEEEKKSIFENYKKLMFINRHSIQTAVCETEEKSADFIISSCKEWSEIKKDLLTITSKLKESWKKKTDMQEVFSYMG
jgi:hypothetical protein